jgi:hypothetical protein
MNCEDNCTDECEDESCPFCQAGQIDRLMDMPLSVIDMPLVEVVRIPIRGKIKDGKVEFYKGVLSD